MRILLERSDSPARLCVITVLSRHTAASEQRYAGNQANRSNDRTVTERLTCTVAQTQKVDDEQRAAESKEYDAETRKRH